MLGTRRVFWLRRPVPAGVEMMSIEHFPEKITPFLCRKLELLDHNYGPDSPEYLALARQYVRNDLEGAESTEKNVRHYEADVAFAGSEGGIPGLERLYSRSIVIETTLVCLAHCRYCLRSNYEKHTLSEKQLIDIARYCGDSRNRDWLYEVLITGGDPLIIPQRLEVLLNALIEHAPNIKVIRIGTRLPSQDPDRVDENVLSLFKNKPSVRFELGTQINHPVELFPEVENALQKIASLGVKIYAQNVLLKGVNDDTETLVRLYNQLRLHNIEAHYLFHCIPMRGIHHLRTSVQRGIELARSLTCSGKISGRAKPMFAVMTDIGKITFYEGVIREQKDGRILLQSNYSLAERLAWNPSWQQPASTELDSNGLMRVWYIDSED
jgi:lysine 2,3-aminomutase